MTQQSRAPQGVFATVDMWIRTGVLDRLPSQIDGEMDGLPWSWNAPANGLRQLHREIERTTDAQKKRDLLSQLRELAMDVRAYLQANGIES